MSEGNGVDIGTIGNGHKRLTAEDLADRTRFSFREKELYVEELGGTLTLKSLTVRERESLPDPSDLLEVNDRGERTARAIKDAAEVFSVIIAEPKLTAAQYEKVVGTWPAEAFDKVTAAFRELIGTDEEAKAAAAEFPAAAD